MTDAPTDLSEPHPTPACPVGESQCEVIDELVSLQKENTELSELVHTDPLTGLSNFRHFIEEMHKEMERTQRNHQPTALVMIDIDHFKQVNDTWGHEAGNLALTHIAKLMRQAVRKLDTPCRYGGEEFVIILPSTTLLTATHVAERLRVLIESSPVTLEGGQSLSITASLGVDIFSDSDKDTPQSFVKRTDQYMYQAKEEGRNRVCRASKHVEDEALVSNEEKNALFGMFRGEED